MRLGLYLAFVATTAAVSGFLIPVRGTFAPPVAVTLPNNTPVIARCFSLDYAPQFMGRWMPAFVRLDPERLRLFDRGGAKGFQAEGWPGHGLYEFAGWRSADSDPIDIAWHHSPILRLPLPPRRIGQTLVGRGGAWSYLSLYDAIVDDGRFTVQATEIVCPPEHRTRSR
jgi:hypothetical protein